MLKKILVTGFAMFVGAAAAQAGNVSLSTLDLANPPGSNNTRAIVDAGGNLLPAGSGYAAVGTFGSLDDAGIAAAGAALNWTALIADFNQFGNAGGIPNFAGIVEHDASAPLPADSSFLTKPIYAVVGNTPTLGGDPATANQWLVFKDDQVFGADNPVFEATADLISATNDSLIVGSLGGGTVALQGALAPLGNVPAITLAGVPEPSTALLLLGGLGGVVFFRRKR